MATKSSKKASKRASAKAVKASRKSTKPAQKPTTKAAKPVSKKTKPQKTPKASPKFRSSYPRAASNPFRVGSSYGIAYDILASSPEGLPRQELITKHAKATGKSEKLSGFDCSVLLSAKTSPTGERHPSCREGFWIEKINDHVQLRTK